MIPKEKQISAEQQIAKAIGASEFPLMLEPFQHQLDAVLNCYRFNTLGLGFKMGTGKTYTAILLLRIKCFFAQEVLHTLIICPKVAVEMWRREIQKFALPVMSDQVQLLNGKHGKVRLQKLRDPSKRIFILNYEGVSIEALWDVISKCRWKALILDEAHRIKDPRGERTKAILALADRVPIKYALTGTNVTKSIENLWSQLRFLSAKEMHKKFVDFRNEYFVDENADWKPYKCKKTGKIKQPIPKWTPRRDAEEELTAIAGKYFIYAESEDVLDLPPFICKNIYVDLEGDQFKHYRELEKDFVTFLNSDEAVVTDLKITRMRRLLEIAAGILSWKTIGDRSRKYQVSYTQKNAKLVALKDQIEQFIDHKIIIWTPFRPSYDLIQQLCNKLKLKTIQIVGGQTQEERTKLVDLFNTDPSYRICIANQSAGSEAIGLQAASVAIYYGRLYSYKDDVQSERRHYRSGSEIHDRVYRINILGNDTIDEDVHETLKMNGELSDLVTNFHKRIEKKKAEESV